MRDFIEAIFNDKNRLRFQYKNYSMSLFKGKYNSYYMIFYLKKEELMELWKETEELFTYLKKDSLIYEPSIDKNTLCLYCIEVSGDDYYQTFDIGTINTLSRQIGYIEEDLSYFTKHVLLYTANMKHFAEANIGNFDEICKEYITNNHFIDFKLDKESNYQYDFLTNLLIKIPFLNFKEYQGKDGREYQSVEKFVTEKTTEKNIDMENIQDLLNNLEQKSIEETTFYQWLDSLEE